jgi:hypothetical protein
MNKPEDYEYIETNETLMDGPRFAPYRRWYAAEKLRIDRIKAKEIANERE